MYQSDLWKYCARKDCRHMLLSFRLLGKNQWDDDKVLGCLYALSNHPEDHYHTVKIAKKSGKTRILLVPDPLLKYVQKHILHHILDGLETAQSATAYRKNISVISNALCHTGKRLVLRLDLKDFFGSISFSMVRKHAFKSCYFPPQVQTLLTALCCINNQLPQGAPTSPAISNLVLKPFDLYMEKWCGERDITYSRYCDDMTFSGSFEAAPVIQKVSGFLNEMGFELNKEKTRILSRGCRQSVTGIVVNEKPQVCREYRRKLRQEIYYCEKYGIEDHLKKIYGAMYLVKEPAAVSRYLESLLGKIRYVLLVCPEDREFKEAAEWVGGIMEI